MQPLLSFATAELGSTPDDLQAMGDEHLEQFLETHRPGLALDQGDVVDRERVLERSEPVELFEHGLRDESALELDDEPQSGVPVGVVLHVVDTLQFPAADQVRDPLPDPLRSDGVGQLGDDDALAPRGDVLDPSARPGAERTAAGLIRLPDTLEADDPASGRKVGSRDEAHEVVERGGRVGQQVPRGLDHLAEIVWRHVGGHADRDPGSSVDQQVGERRRQHVGLLESAVVVGDHVDDVLVERPGQQSRRFRQPAFGVPVRGRTVVRRTEVSVPVDQRDPHDPRLGHPDERVVDGAVAVRVQLAHHVADDPAALDVGTVGAQPHLLHLVQDPALDRLEAVARVRDGPGVDDGVRVLEEAAAHLRPIRPDDADRLLAFYDRVSDESKYNRFFAPYPRLSPRDVEKFTHVDHVHRAALILLIGDDMIAVGRYEGLDGAQAEVAFLVEDAHQGRGVGSVLLEHLAQAARERGVRRFVADVLPANHRMVSVFSDAGYTIVNRLEDGVVHVEFEIAPTEGAVGVMAAREQRAEARSIERLLTPGSVAVVGARRSPDKAGQVLVRNLVGSGFTGPVYPVNPSAAAVSGVPAYASVRSIPGEVDLVVVAVPADSVMDVILDCADKGAKGLVVVSAGFAEAGGGGP